MTSLAAMAYHDELKTLRERNGFLEEENRQLKAGLERSPEIVEFRIPGIHLTRFEARLLNALIQSGMVTSDAVHAYLYPDRFVDEAPEIRIIGVFLHRLRRKLKPLGIEIRTVWGRGYSMEATDRTTLKAFRVEAVTRIGNGVAG